MWAHLIIVLAPILYLLPGVIKAHEPMRVEALGTEASVERFNERIVRRCAWSREVERDVVRVGPEIQVARDELRALIDTNGLGIVRFSTNTVEGLDDVSASGQCFARRMGSKGRISPINQSSGSRPAIVVLPYRR